MKTNPLLLGLLLLAPACDRADDPLAPGGEAEALEVREEAPALAAPPSTTPAQAAPSRDHAKPHLAEERAVVPDAKAAFEELATLIDAKYVDGPLSEDELWTGAMEGVLARLVQLPDHEINALLSPRAHEELIIGTKGRLVGVGVMIEHVAGVVVVRDVITGGPADEAGLKAGDRILGVDGQRVEPLDLREVVDLIRGPEGSEVELFVQRDIEEWNQTVTRGLVQVDSVAHRMLDGGVGYLLLTSFGEKTPAEIDDALWRLTQEGATGLVLDLRHCPGGLLDASLQVASRFVPEGELLLRVEHRKGDGQPEEHRSEGEHPWQGRPLVVLIGPKTASSAELLADALREHDHGLLVGEPTLGKHTIESIHELSGGWAVKLSVGRFTTASGQSSHGLGIAPDIQIPMPEGHKPRRIEELDPAADPPLATALGLLRND